MWTPRNYTFKEFVSRFLRLFNLNSKRESVRYQAICVCLCIDTDDSDFLFDTTATSHFRLIWDIRPIAFRVTLAISSVNIFSLLLFLPGVKYRCAEVRKTINAPGCIEWSPLPQVLCFSIFPFLSCTDCKERRKKKHIFICNNEVSPQLFFRYQRSIRECNKTKKRERENVRTHTKCYCNFFFVGGSITLEIVRVIFYDELKWKKKKRKTFVKWNAPLQWFSLLQLQVKCLTRVPFKTCFLALTKCQTCYVTSISFQPKKKGGKWWK